MNERQKVLLFSVLIMTGVAVAVGAISLFGSYRAAFEQQRERLVETVHSRARLIEAVARFNAMYSATDGPGGAEAATLSQIVQAHERFRGFGQTGEFALARREGDQIVFLLRHRHSDLDHPRPIPFDSELAEPMRRALSGESGTVIGLDYRGEKVLAAYEPVGVVNWGTVAKIDLTEIRGVFAHAGGAVTAVGLVVILAGTLLFLRSTDPLIRRLEIGEARLRTAQRVARMGSWDWNIVTNELHWSDEIYRIFGLSPWQFGATYDAFLASVHPGDRAFVQEHVDAALNNNADYRIDHRIVLPSGEVRHVHEQGEVTREADGAAIRMVGTVIDITERKRAEEAVREHARLLEAFFRYSLTAIVFLDRDFNFIRVNEAYARACRRDVSEFPGHNHFEFYPSDAQEIFEEVRETKIPFQAIGRPFVFADHPEWGVTYWDWSLVPILDDAGQVELLVFSLNDVTERKRAEEAQRLDEARLQVLVQLNEMTEAPLQRVSDFVLEEAVRLTGSKYGFLGFMSDDESVQNVYTWSGDAMKECRMVDKPTAFPIAEAGLWGEVVRQRKPIIVNDYSALKTWKKGYPEGHVHISRFLGVPVFDGERIVAVAAVANKGDEYQEGDVRQLTLLMDGMWRIVEHQRAEAALRESEERLQAILDNTTAVVYAKDTGGRFLLVNRRFEELFHVTRAEIMGKTDHDLWSKELADAFRTNDARVLETREAVQFEEVAAHDGGLHTYISVKFPLCDAAGKPYAVCGISTDITDRQRAEVAVRESRNFLQTVIDEIPDPLMVIDRDYRIVLANRAVRELAGGKDPVAGCLTCYQASHKRDAPCEETNHPCPVRRVMSTKAPAVVTHTHFDAEGSEILQEMVAAPIFDEAGEVVQIIESSRDITARVRAEEEARQRQAELAHVSRVSTMGQLASGLAHELNQPLCAILSSAQACRRLIRSGRMASEEVDGTMSDVCLQAERAGEIIRRLRDFVRKQDPRRLPVDINEIAKEAVAFAATEARHSAVTTRLELVDQAPPVLADGIQIQQVILNLVRNAIEAMKDPRTAKRELTVQLSLLETGMVEVAVRDTGKGLSADASKRMFDPFFTTKSTGMGIGLSISRSIIEAHGGRLWATANPDCGVTFRFTLPTTLGAADHEARADGLRCG